MPDPSDETVIETLYSEGKVTFRRSDGSIIATLSAQGEPSGITSIAGQSSQPIPTLYKYNYNSNPSPPPSSSQVRSDTYDPLLTSVIWVHRTDNENKDEKYLLMLAKAGDRFFIQDTDNSDSHATFLLESDPVDGGSYVEFNVSVESFSGVPMQGTSVMIGIIR